MTASEFHHSRLRLNRTQAELSRMLGVTPTTVQRYEVGKRAISDTIAILLRLLVKLYADDDRYIDPARQRVGHPRQLARVA